MEPSQLIKSDLDRVSEAHLQDALASLRLLTEKLYKRNPRELKKSGFARAEDAVERLFGSQHNWRFPELGGKWGTDAMQLAFKADYGGDRVFALMAGLGGMTLAAFGDRYEFYLFNELNAQRLYNAARNVEIAVWKMGHDRDAEGNLLLLSNELGPTPNLSFEREFGKVIGNLDTLSRVIEDKTNRTVVKVVQSMASAVFLPVAALK
ncbi:lipoprotein [Denitratisoma sp. agr-D3]